MFLELARDGFECILKNFDEEGFHLRLPDIKGKTKRTSGKIN